MSHKLKLKLTILLLVSITNSKSGNCVMSKFSFQSFPLRNAKATENRKNVTSKFTNLNEIRVNLYIKQNFAMNEADRMKSIEAVFQRNYKISFIIDFK